MDDRSLLREYLERQSEQAFAELVARHVNLVYATALRVVGEAQTAQDVAQAVFIHLARKARRVRAGNALPGWLYRVTYRVAANALRTERRRREREIEALMRAELNSDSQRTWAALEPLLDEAVHRLSQTEQNAVVLRFFEGKSLREVGRALALSEDAVQKRISRAVEKLRTYFARRGLTASSAAIGAALLAHSAQTAPAGLAAGLANGSLAAASGTAAGALTGLIARVVLSKAKIAVVAGAGIAAVVAWVVSAPQKPGGLATANLVQQQPAGQFENAPPEDQLPADASEPGTQPAPRGSRGRLRSRAQDAAHLKTESENANVVSEAEPWRQRFDAVYQLREAEVLRHIAPPFIPERTEYYRARERRQAAAIADPPTYFVFHQNDQGLQSAGYGFVGSDHKLEGVLRHAIGLKRYEFEGPDGLLSLAVNGDWTVREGAILESLLAALEPILRDATGRNIHFEKDNIDREVIAARGHLALEDGKRIQLYAENKDPSGGGSGDLPEFLKWVGDRLNLSFVNEAQPDSPTELQWDDHSDSSYARMGERRAELTDKVLQNLAAQTSLSFERERRPMQVWSVREPR
jgi:RNA polymerase sigma factor (sigma-70 family)